MRHAPRTSRPRHLAGTPRAAWQPSEHLADFDVEAALDAETDFDFDGLFAGDDAADAPTARARVARHRIAFAVSVTLAALPLLVLDNLGARAEAPEDQVSAEAPYEAEERTALPERVATTEAPPVVVDVTVAVATPYVAEPSTSSTEAPVTTTTAKPTTTTTAKPTTTTAKPTTTTAPAPRPTPTTVAALTAPKGGDPSSTATWEQLAQCESGGRWDAVSQPRNGHVYYGGLQFSLSTWQGFGGTGMPNEASKDQQIAIGKRVQAKQGWGAWPSCARRFGWL